MTASLIFLHALSPLHAGTGQSAGAIDLPVARDRATGFPLLPGSSLKGSLRALTEGQEVQGADSKLVHALFGPPTENASEHAGALLFGDAYLLLLPVRSLSGTFAWVTSPYLLGRLVRDAKEAGGKFTVPVLGADVARAAVAPGHLLTAPGVSKAVLEDLDLALDLDPRVEALGGEIAGALGLDDAWKAFLKKRLCVVSDEVMAFLARHATEVVTRVALDDDSKTVKRGQLWREESLPVETVLVSLVVNATNGKTKSLAADPINALRAALYPGGAGAGPRRTVIFGGKSTVGRGRCAVTLGVPGGAQ